MSAAPITALYNQLSYSNFYAVRQTGLSTLLIKPNGNQAAVGNNVSTLTSAMLGLQSLLSSLIPHTSDVS